MTAVDCGVLEHDESCLCDVVLPDKPTPIVTSLMDNWVLGMVAKYFDLSYPWDSDKLGFLMEKASVFLDEWFTLHKRTDMFADLEHLTPQEQGHETYFQYCARARQLAQRIVERTEGDVTLREVADIMRLNELEFISLMTFGKPDSAVTMDDYMNFVSDLRAGCLFREASRNNNFTTFERQGFRKWLDQVFVEPYVTPEIHRIRAENLRQAIREGRKKNAD